MARLEWQRQLAEDRIAGRLPHDVLLLLEHPPVVTLGGIPRRASAASPPASTCSSGARRRRHVSWAGSARRLPHSRPAAYKKDLHWYLRTLEQALMRLWAFSPSGGRNPGFTGVWTGGRDREHRHPREAMGHVARVRAHVANEFTDFHGSFRAGFRVWR